MSSTTRSRRSATPSRSTILAAVLSLVAAACGDGGTAPELPAREVGVVVTSTDVALTVFDVDEPLSTRTIGLGADGSPVSVAVNGSLAAVPLGVVPSVVIADVTTGTVLRTIALPAGSGATGVAFASDSVVVVANPNLGTVSPVNVHTGTVGAQITVGRFPQAIVRNGSRLFVLNAELENFTPDGPSTVTVLDAASLAVLRTIVLSGQNAAAGAVGPDNRLYVVHSGSWGSDNGALSVIDLVTLSEVDFVSGFGNFPGSIAVGSDGRVHVGAFGVGTLAWDSRTRAFLRGPDRPVAPGAVASTSGLAYDGEGRLYALTPDCRNPSVAHRLAPDYTSEVTIPVGICPFGLVFTTVVDGA